MKRIKKRPDSTILSQNMHYKVKGDNRKIRDALLDEQHYICAYTEKCLERSVKKEIDHFDPTLKGTSQDGYQNWFLVRGQWNLEKSGVNKWVKHQPTLHPTAADLEQRIIFDDGDYILADEKDTAAANLIKLIKLDDVGLTQERKNYIALIKQFIELLDTSPQDCLDELIQNQPEQVYFIRALEETFDIKVNFALRPT